MTTLRLALDRAREHLERTLDDRHQARTPFTRADIEELTAIIADYQRAVVNTQLDALPILGRRLYAWLDGESGWFSNVLDDFIPPLRLELATSGNPKPADRVLLEAPWELLFGDAGFLAADVTVRYTPLRRVGRLSKPQGPRPGALSILFMAAAPRELTELSFEREEARILAHTADMSLDLFVEETGTARELAHRAAQLSDDHDHALHVVHLSCHGDNAPEPVLMLEDETGGVARTSVTDLCDALGPRVLEQLGLMFTSACLSAVGGDFSPKHDSLALALTRSGVQAVLGWAGSVFDDSASRFAAKLYERLARGDTDLEEAVARTRRDLLMAKPEPDPHWHLARLFVGAGGGGLLARPEGARRKGPPIHGGFLGGDRRSPVAGPDDFVGRRLLLQQALRCLRNRRHAGLLLHGPGSVGKSSLAARIVDRMNSHRTVVMYGSFGGRNLLQAVHDKFGTAVADWHERWKHEDDESVGRALRELLDEVLTDTSANPALLLVLDDFEQMLSPRPSALHVVEPSRAALMAGILRAFLHADTRSRLLLTSRYKFRLLDPEGRDLSDALVPLPLASFRPGEAMKRARREPAPAPGHVDLRPRCVDACHGNPALLALLLRLATNDPARCVSVIEQLESQARERPPDDEELCTLLNAIATAQLLDSLDAGDAELFRRSLVFRAPLPLALAPALASAESPCQGSGERLVALGAWEQVPDVVEGPAFVCNRLLHNHARRRGMEPVAAPLLQRIAQRLVPGLAEHWRSCVSDEGATQQERALAGWQLLVLALCAKQHQIAADFALLALGWVMNSVPVVDARHFAKSLVDELEGSGAAQLEARFYLAVIGLFQPADDGVFLSRCIEHGIASLEHPPQDTVGLRTWGRLVQERARLHTRGGDFEAAEGDLHSLLTAFAAPTFERDRAIFASALADIREIQGDLDGAKDFYESIAVPTYAKFGDLRSWALAKLRLAQIAKQRGRPSAALAMVQQHTIPALLSIGCEVEVAFALDTVADVLLAKGMLDEALRIRTREQLPRLIAHGHTLEHANALGKIADILLIQGRVEESLAIRIDEQLPVVRRAGDQLGVAAVMGRIADVYEQTGRVDDALKIRLEQELPILEKLGVKKEVAITSGKIATIYRDRGNIEEALALLEGTCMPIFKSLGVREMQAHTESQIGDIWLRRGKLEQATRYFCGALRVYENIGDPRGAALMRGRLAHVDIKAERLDRALETLRDDLLLFYESINEMRFVASTHGSIAAVHELRQEYDDAHSHRTRQIDILEQIGDVGELAVARGALASIIHHRGNIDEAIRIRREEVIPVLSSIQDRHSLIFARTNLANLLLKRSYKADKAEARELLQAALADACMMGIPEAELVEKSLARCDEDQID